MCPFVDDYDDFSVPENNGTSKLEQIKSHFFQDERKFFVIGGVASVVVFLAIVGIMYFNSQPIDLEDLPVIRADTAPFKQKAPENKQVKHQDKVVYDNISGDSHVIVEKVAPQQEEVISIPDVEVESALSAEEKRDIIRAFDELAPEKEYRINYVKRSSEVSKAATPSAPSKALPPINRNVASAKKSRSAVRQKVQKMLAEVDNANIAVNNDKNVRGTMLQIASLRSKTAAEAEYRRLASKSAAIRKIGKRIQRVDLGSGKGIRYRVQIGPFSSTEDANKAIATLKKNGISAYISR